MSIPSLSDTFRTYVRFATQKLRSDEHGAFEYSSGALDVVMEFIADNIDETVIQDLAHELGVYEVGETDHLVQD